MWEGHDILSQRSPRRIKESEATISPDPFQSDSPRYQHIWTPALQYFKNIFFTWPSLPSPYQTNTSRVCQQLLSQPTTHAHNFSISPQQPSGDFSKSPCNLQEIFVVQSPQTISNYSPSTCSVHCCPRPRRSQILSSPPRSSPPLSSSPRTTLFSRPTFRISPFDKPNMDRRSIA